MPFFERYLSLWVALCIVAGIALGLFAPGIARALIEAVGESPVLHVDIGAVADLTGLVATLQGELGHPLLVAFEGPAQKVVLDDLDSRIVETGVTDAQLLDELGVPDRDPRRVARNVVERSPREGVAVELGDEKNVKAGGDRAHPHGHLRFEQSPAVRTRDAHKGPLEDLPGGRRRYDAVFIGMGNLGYFWSSSEDCDAGYALMGILHYNSTQIEGAAYSLSNGMSVRCVKD